MSNVPTGRARSFKWAATLSCLVAMALPINQARALNPLGFYVGGAVGQARVEATAPNASGFRENHSAFKVMVGVRPISVIGAELAYADFGHPSHLSTDVTMKGAAAFGIFYLPVPIIDVYVKGGLARLQTTMNGTAPGVGTCPISQPNCALFRLDRTNTTFAGGAGAQFKLGSFAVRGEYERFNAAGGNPGLFSLGLTWAF